MGCGWLGLPLAKVLLKKGYTVRGTTTTQSKISELKETGIDPFQIEISDKDIKGPIIPFLKGLDILVLNLPPRLRGNGPKENYVEKVKLLLNSITSCQIPKIIFISSTSVYGDKQGEVNEKTVPLPETASGKQLWESEKLIKDNTNFQSTIVRFGGLIGPNRHPITMLSGRANLKGGDAPVNLIHLDDCMGIIIGIIEKKVWGQVLNAVYPEHPTKREYYTQIAEKRNIDPPVYLSDSTENHKTIQFCNHFLTNEYDFLTSINL